MRSSTLVLVALGIAISSAHAANPYDRELAERRAEARRLAGRPQAIAPLLGLLELWPLVDDRAAVGAALDEVIADPRQRHDVRARASYLRSVVDDHLGQPEQAARRRDSLGFLRRFQVVGPFDNEGKAGHGRRFPVEEGLAETIDPQRELDAAGGGGRRVRFRPLPEALLAQGMAPLDAVLRPETNITAYATTFVHLAAEAEVALRFGSSGAIKIWVGDRLAAERDAYRPLRVDQDVAVARLAAGWNRITVKVGAGEGHCAFFLRLTKPDGSPLAFASASAPGGPLAVAKPGAIRARALDLGADLRRGAAGREAAAIRAWGLFLHFVAPEDTERRTADRELVRAARLAPSSEALRLAAMATPEANQRRKLLEEGQALAGRATPHERAKLLTELGESYARVHRQRRAEELWRAALTVEPDHFPARLKLIDLLADRGLPAAAHGELRELLRGHGALALLQAAAELAGRRSLGDEEQGLQEQLHRATRDDLGPLRALLASARHRGEVGRALELAEQMQRLRPDLPSLLFDRVDILEGVGRLDEAHQLLAAALVDCPDDARLLERDGKILHRLGRDEPAVAQLKRALAMRPQNPELRLYLRELESRRDGRKSGDDLARAWAEPPPAILRRTPPLPKEAKESARVLLDRTVIRVHDNGLSETYSQRLVEILDQRGAREQDAVDIRYTPDTQSVEVKSAKVYKPSGEVVEATAQVDRDVSEPWYGLYYDVHAESIQFSRLEPGDVVAVEYVVSDVGRRNLFADYFGDLHLLQEELPRVESDFVLITPQRRAFYFNEPRLDGLEVSHRRQGAEVIHRFRARNVPKIATEAGMPGMTEAAAYVHVSTYQSWEEVATWYTGLVRDQLVPDQAIRDAVAAAVKGITDERARIGAIYDLVVKKTRYIGLEFGIHGYKPYRVAQVFARKFGDCKDKASLLVVMLKEIGVEATLVLARTRRGGDVADAPASLAVFDHAIAYVPKYDLFLDGTAEFSGSAELPAQDQDIPVLVVQDPRHGGRGRLARTPVTSPTENEVLREAEVTLAATGEAKVALRMSIRGQAASEWRSHYQSPGERRERFEKAENAHHPGARVETVELPTVEELERPVLVKASLTVPRWARRDGEELAMAGLGRDGDLARSYARLSERKHDLILGYPWQQRDRIRLTVPPGFSVRRLPEARRVEGPFGSLVITATVKGRVVELESALTVNRHRIARGDYAAFRRFCSEADAAFGQELVLRHD